MQGLGRYLLLKAALLRVRLLPRFMAVATLLACTLPALLTTRESGTGYGVLAETVSLLVAVLVTLGAVLGAVALSADASSGSLRGVLTRPVSRDAVVLGEGIALVVVCAALYLTGLLLAWLACWTLVGFGPAVVEDYVIVSAERLASYARLLTLVPLPAVLAAPLVALAVSTCVDDVATAIVTAIALVLGPLLFGRLVSPLPDWVFTERAFAPLDVLEQLAEGIELRLGEVERPGYVLMQLLQPAACAALFVAAAVLVLRRRDFRL